MATPGIVVTSIADEDWQHFKTRDARNSRPHAAPGTLTFSRRKGAQFWGPRGLHQVVRGRDAAGFRQASRALFPDSLHDAALT